MRTSGVRERPDPAVPRARRAARPHHLGGAAVLTGPSRSPRLPRVVRRQSAIAGWGVYAAQAIEEDARVISYAGELISQAEAWRREQRYLRRGRIWLFTVSDRWARDGAVGGNVARYINHSCEPNCYTDIVGRTVWILAARPIAAGEELTYDYNTDGVAGIRCLCRGGCTRIL